jgi:hypothetical protein
MLKATGSTTKIPIKPLTVNKVWLFILIDV